MAKRLTIIALGSRGDVLPYTTLGRALLEEGYQVRFATFESFRSMVETRSLQFHAIAGDAEALLRLAMGNNMMGTRNPFTMMRAIRRSFAAIADDYARAFSSSELADSDAILNQLPGGLYGRDVAEKLGVPHVMLSVIPLERTAAFPNPLLASRSLGGPLNRATHALAARFVWSMYRQNITNFRHMLGLGDAPRRLPFGDAPVINGFSERVVPRPADWPPNIHITGWWMQPEAGWHPPQALLDFLAAGDPPVFIGFGSMIAPDPAALTRTLIDGVTASGRRAVISAGWADLGKGTLPDHIFRLDYTPYAWLFPRMAAVIHHGGSGTTGYALAGGVPSMIVPFGADQFYWGKRTYQLGVGPAPISIKWLSAERLAEAIGQMVGNTPAHATMRQRAAELGAALRAEDGVAEAVRLVRHYVN